MKKQRLVSSLALRVVRIYLRDGQFSNDVAVPDLHPSKGTQWVAYMNEIFFDHFVCAPTQ